MLNIKQKHNYTPTFGLKEALIKRRAFIKRHAFIKAVKSHYTNGRAFVL